MNIILTESQYKSLLNESTGNITSFVDEIIDIHPKMGEFRDFFIKSIENSGCDNIFFDNITSLGLSLHDKCVINYSALKNLGDLIFITFHEVAHQYQYKKYGKELIYDIYTGELEIDSAIVFLKHLENTADQFGLRKVREFKRLGLDMGEKPLRTKGGYEHYTDKMYVNYVDMLADKIKSAGITDPDKISEYIYNMIKIKL